MKQLEQYIQPYLDYCKWQKGLSNKTIKAYHIDLRDFYHFINQQKKTLEKETLSAYITNLQQQYQPRSVKRKIASIRAFFNFLEYEEIFTPNPFSHMRIKLHIPSVLPRTIPLPIIERILQTAYLQQERDDLTTLQQQTTVRDIAVLELLFATGMRVSEVCTLKVESVDLTQGEIIIYGKGAKERVIQLEHKEVQHAMQAYFKLFQTKMIETGFFFINRLHRPLSEQSVRQMVNRYTKLAGIDKHITPHMFRHSFATLLLEEDVDIRYIQRLLGHSSITTTQIYTHVSSKKQRDILLQKHPRNKIKI